MNIQKVRIHILKNWEKYCLSLFIVVALILRFYNYPFRYNLSDEPIRDAAVATIGARDLQLPLVGPFSSAGPFTFGPWYYYQLALARIVFQVPYAPWIYLSIASVLCIFLLYKIGEFFDKKFGIILAFLGAISASLILSGTHLTNPNLSNLFAFLSIYIFIKLIRKNHSYWWGFALGASLGIAINIHYQMMGLMILPLLLLVFKPKRYINILCIGAGLFVTFLPMIFFDLNNHWFNFRNILYYYTEGKKLIYVPNRWLFYVRDFWPSYIEEVTGLPGLVGAIVMIIFGGIFGYSIYKRKVSKELLVLVIAFVFNFILLRYYWGERFFGYLNYIRPFILIFEGYVIFYFYQLVKKGNIKKLYLLLVVVTLLIFNIPRIIPLLTKDKFTVQMYETEQHLIAQYPNEKFKLFLCPGPGNTYYSSESHSILFLLDSHKLLSDKGRPVGFENENCYPTGVRHVPDFEIKQANFTRINGTDMIDLSSHSSASISAMQWQKHSLRLISDTTTRWWFNEQP